MLLRVLILGDFVDIYIPEEIGKLIHLRYLVLTGSCHELPSSIENLQNLWVFNLKDLDTNISFTPNICGQMRDLEHLYLPSLHNEEITVHRMQKLKTLWNGNGGEWLLSEMPRLSPSLQKLQISGITSEEQLKAVLCTPSISSNHLQTLDLHWFTPTSIYHRSKKVKLDNMHNLYKCKSLKTLSLDGIIGRRTFIVFPPNLVVLGLWNSCFGERDDIDMMGIIDKCCPQLKTLFLKCNAYVGDELVCHVNSFQQLEKLHLNGADELERWTIKSGAMSNLKELLFYDCRNLQLTDQGWEFVSKIPNVIYQRNYWRAKESSQFEENLKQSKEDVRFDKPKYTGKSWPVDAIHWVDD